jgi:predicted membrane protein
MKVAPLTGTFMMISILGFVISLLFVFKYTPSFGIAFALVFALMFIAAVISMTYTDVNAVLKLERSEMKGAAFEPAEPRKKAKRKKAAKKKKAKRRK